MLPFLGYRQQNANLQRLGVLNTKTAGFHHAKGVAGLITNNCLTAAMMTISLIKKETIEPLFGIHLFN